MSWDALQHELGNRFFAGPYISPSPRTGRFSQSLCFSGLKIEGATSETKFSADILIRSRDFWFPLYNLYLLPDQVPFSFYAKTDSPSVIDSQHLVRLVPVLNEIYTQVEVPVTLLIY